MRTEGSSQLEEDEGAPLKGVSPTGPVFSHKGHYLLVVKDLGHSVVGRLRQSGFGPALS